MAKSNENQIFKELATRYVEHYGEMLSDEAALLNCQPSVSPRMDRNVRRFLKAGGTRRHAAGFAALAAMVAIVLLIPIMSNQINLDKTGGEGAVTTSPPNMSEEPPTPQIIPISFSLPNNLTVADSKLDNGKSVYYLSSSDLDDIVMTMELKPREDVFYGLKETLINDHTVYYKYTPDFGIMAFEKQDITYVLTCRHDINTLVTLAKAIL